MNDIDLPRGAPLPPGYEYGVEFTGPLGIALVHVIRRSDLARVTARIVDPVPDSEFLRTSVAKRLAACDAWQR